jgi:hypothetical protein
MEQHIPQLDIRTTDLLNDLIAALRIQREIVESQIRTFERLSKSSGNQHQGKTSLSITRAQLEEHHSKRKIAQMDNQESVKLRARQKPTPLRRAKSTTF